MITIPGYTLISPLSESKDLILHRAIRTRDGLPVLIKLPAAADRPPLILRRLAHEYELARNLDPNRIVRPIAMERHAGTAALVLEHGPSRSLVSMLGSPMEIQAFLQTAIGITDALAELHRCELIHKDIKPEHVLLNEEGRVWLTGLGIASRLPKERQAPEPPDVIDGTLAYMAPEQTGRMNRSIDSRSDLYALGVTFYQMLTGELPFSAGDPMEWVHCHIARQAEPPIRRAPECPAPLSAVVMKLLAKNAEERYQSAVGLASDLRTCLKEWQSQGDIKPFPLGEKDMVNRLIIPEKLYGRQTEIDTLMTAFERVMADGRSELVLVSGYAGVGKTAVVNEFQKALVTPRGLFAAGKFDQYKRDIPYATLIQALQTIVRHILGENEAEMEMWRETLQKAVSPNGQLIISLIPEVERIIGAQPPVPDLPPQEARNRFRMVLLRFIGVFAGAEHPLTLFLDDLQWLDAATLELLTHLTTEPKKSFFLLIGAYRNNEVTPAHPLMQALETIRKKGGRVQDIVLAPLTLDDAGSLVADALHSSREQVLPLAQLLREKTGGNPFFAIQFLTTLAEEKLLAFDGDAKRWRWDLAQIHAKGFTDNVVDLMVDKLGRLPETTREALKQFACLGSVAKITTLTTVYGQSEDALHAALWEAARAGLIVRSADTYNFLHDRMQEAAYALIPEADRKAFHLKIGRLLLAQYPKEVLEDQVFDVIDQFNRSIDIVTDADEKETLRRLNTAAGRKARAAVAYASARQYLKQAMALLPANAWNKYHAESLTLFLESAECEYLVGNFKPADRLLDDALEQAGNTLDIASVHRLRIRLYQLSGRFHEALGVSLEALRRFGLTFPETGQDARAETEAELLRVHDNLRGRRIMDLGDIPLTSNAKAQALVGLLADVGPLIFIMRQDIFLLFTARSVNICLQCGHGVESSLLYSNHAMALAADLRNILTAEQFSKLAIALNARTPESAPVKGKILFLHAINIIIWHKPVAESLPLLEKAFGACLDVGDLVYGSYTTYHAIWHHLENGDPLAHVSEVARRFTAFARQSRIGTVYQMDRMVAQFVLALEGKTRSLTNFSDSAFDEAACAAVIEQAGFGVGIAFYYIMKQMAAFMDEDYDQAMQWVDRMSPWMSWVASFINGATFHFHYALTLAALHAQAAVEQQRSFVQTLEAILSKLKSWADHCPENFANRYFLVSAEMARIEGRDLDAMRLYDQAVGSARESDLVHQEALAAEIASRFYRLRGFDRIAEAYLRDAHGAYARWGALGKARRMAQQYPQLREMPSSALEATVSAEAQDLDILAVVQAARTISGEIHLDSLLKTLMRIVLENAGAQQGYLLLNRNKDFSLAAAARVENQNVAIKILGEPGFPKAVLPASILNYVSRSGEWVLLDDAAGQNPYSADEYFTRRHPKSVLCFPVTKQTELIGLFYLENDLAAHAFTPDHLTLLELLAAQAAISLENALIYRALQESEKELRQLTRFHRTILNSAAYCIVSGTRDGIITSFNPAAERLLGYTAEEVIGKKTPLLWHDPQEIAQHALRLSEVLGQKIEPGLDVFTARPKRHLPEENKWTYIRKDGTRVPVNLSVTALQGEDHQITGYVGMIYDLTERKQAEAEIHRLNAELEQRVADRTAELQSANKELKAFAYSVSHDLRAPLRHVDGFIGLLQKNAGAALDEKSRHYLDSISQAADKMGLLIDDLLTFSRMGRQAISVEHVDLGLLGADIIRELEPDAAGRTIDWRIGKLPAVSGDAAMLRIALDNLIANALKFTRPRGEARIEIGSLPEKGGDVVIFVRDNGAGFDMAYKDKLFGVFQRLHRVDEFEGTGIGLATVRRIIARHGGRVWAESAVDQGATFYFSLPLRPHGDGGCLK